MGLVFVIRKQSCDRFVCKGSRTQKWQMFSESDRRGVSRNPEARLDQLHSAQPCCDIEIIHTVAVEDMADVEAELHSVFRNSNVKLVKSREWFNLNPLQVQQCIWRMSAIR